MAANNIYGIWSNGILKNNSDFNTMLSILKGIYVRFRWNDYETTVNDYDEEYWDAQFAFAKDNGLPFGFVINISPSTRTSAAYIFEPPYNVPKLITSRDIYPYYFDEQFSIRFNALKAHIRQKVQNLPDTDRTLYTFWQSAEGSTGDEAPYKGDLTDVTIGGVSIDQNEVADYEITDDQWETYKRNENWQPQYDFLEAETPFLQLLFNTSNNGANWDWLFVNTPNAWAKAGDPTHSYNLPNELYYTARLREAFNSTEFANRVRGEFESTDENTWWSESPKQNLTAVIFSAIHHGVDIFNIAPSVSANNFGTDLSIYTLANEFFGTRNVSETNVGFVLFRQVIDVGDTTKYPEYPYGALIDPLKQDEYDEKYDDIINNDNLNTYEKQNRITGLIVDCLNPLRLSLLQSAFPTAAYRTITTDEDDDMYNQDFGVNMIADNYCKYITQYSPDTTSVGAWRNGDKDEDCFGRFGRKTKNSSGLTNIRCTVDLLGNNIYDVTVDVYFLDTSTYQWSFRYYNGTTEVSAGTVTNTGTGKQAKHTFNITDFSGGGHLSNSTDFKLNYVSGGDTTFYFVKFKRNSQSSGNTPPTANAGSDVIVTYPDTTAVLNGSASTAGSSPIASYLWQYLGSGSVTIVSPASATTNVTGLVDSGTYAFRLTVTDGNGLTSSNEVTVFVVIPELPTVNAGADFIVDIGVGIGTLQGTATGFNVAVQWAKDASSPDGGDIDFNTALLTNIINLQLGVYIYTLTATDGLGNIVSDSVTVTAIDTISSSLPSYDIIPSYATTIQNKFDILDGLQKTMVYKTEQNTWAGSYGWTPDCMECAGNKFFAWKDGMMYLMNENTTSFNNIFGVYYPQRICFSANIEPTQPKDLMGIAVEGNAAPKFTVGYADYEFEQITDLTENEFTNKEGIFYSEFYRDRLTPSIDGTVVEKLLNGDFVKNVAPKIMCEFRTYNTKLIINFVDIAVDFSAGHINILPRELNILPKRLK